MELKAELKKPYTQKQRLDFIVQYNHNLGFEIKEDDTGMQAWGLSEEESARIERQKILNLSLTPSDVERALYKAKGIDFEDLKALIAEKMPEIDIKALSIEFRAKDFYRGANYNGIGLFDAVGQILGYSSEDIDYLFKNKQLPQKGEENNAEL